MLPLAAQPAVHCSTILTRSPVYGICLLAGRPMRLILADAALEEQPVADGEVQVACWTRIGMLAAAVRPRANCRRRVLPPFSQLLHDALLVPEQVELVARRDLRRQPQVAVLPRSDR